MYGVGRPLESQTLFHRIGGDTRKDGSHRRDDFALGLGHELTHAHNGDLGSGSVDSQRRQVGLECFPLFLAQMLSQVDQFPSGAEILFGPGVGRAALVAVRGRHIREADEDCAFRFIRATHRRIALGTRRNGWRSAFRAELLGELRSSLRSASDRVPIHTDLADVVVPHRSHIEQREKTTCRTA